MNATGGSIELRAGGALNGSLTNTELTLTAGAVNASINGGKVIGNDYALSEVLQLSGNVSISGSFNASALQLVTEGESRVDVVTGNSGNSGFLKQGDSYVQLFNGGTFSIDGVTVSHQNAVTTLTMGNDGYARSTGGINYNEYLLTGHDRVSTQQIHIGAGAGASVRQEGGLLTVNDETTVKTTSGEIVLSGSTLLGEVFDARVTANGGSIAATLGGITAVTITGEVSMSENNSHSGVTTLADGSLTITNANALGSGDIVSTGESKLIVDGVTLALNDTIANTGKLTLSGNIDASALQLNKTEACRLSLSGGSVGLTESGFSKDAEYSVLIVDGGTTVNAGANIYHQAYLSRTELKLGEDGIARAGGTVDYSHFWLEGDDSFSVSEIAAVSITQGDTLKGVTMESGLLTVNADITVNATGGHICISDDSLLDGSICDTELSSIADDFNGIVNATISGDSSVNINGGHVTLNGENDYIGGTIVNGGALLAGSDSAFGSGDITVNSGGTLDLDCSTIANTIYMNGNSVLNNANGASSIVLGSGSNVSFGHSFTLSTGKSLAVHTDGATYNGALTLGGGTLALSGKLTVNGEVNFVAGSTTVIDLSAWKGAEDGDILVDLSSNSQGYTDGCLTLSGIDGDWELRFEESTGILTLLAAQEITPFTPVLSPNQEQVYDTIKDIMAEGKPEGELGKLAEQITSTRNEEELRSQLSAVSGSEYATLMSSQIDGNLGHMRNLRSKVGQGWQLMGNNYMRAMVEMFSHESSVNADTAGRGYERSEIGGQFTLEFTGCMHVSSGVAVAASRTRLTPDNALEQTVNNSYVDFYTSYRSNGYQNTGYTAKFSLGLGTHDYKLERNVLGMNAEAETNGFSVNFMHESAYDVSLSEDISLQIFGVLESSFSRLKGFQENGLGTASLVMEEQDAFTSDISLGVRYVQMFDSWTQSKATFTVHSGVTATVGDTNVNTKLHFAGARNHEYSQSGAERNRWGYNFGAGLHLPVNDTSAVYFHGETTLRGDSSEWNVNVGYQVAF